MGRGLLKETTMRTKHLFTSAAIAAVLAVAVPVHAQILGGGAQGGLGGTLGGTLGGGAGGMRGTMAGGAGGSMYGGAGGQLDGLGRIDRTVDANARDGARAGARAAGKGEASADKAQGSARHDVRKGEADARKGGHVAADTASDAVASAPRATASTVASGTGQGEAQTRNVDVGGALSGATSASGAGNTGMSAVEPPREAPDHRTSASGPAPRKPAAGEGVAHTRNPGKPAASGDTDWRHEPSAAASGDVSASASAEGSMSASTPR